MYQSDNTQEQTDPPQSETQSDNVFVQGTAEPGENRGATADAAADGKTAGGEVFSAHTDTAAFAAPTTQAPAPQSPPQSPPQAPPPPRSNAAKRKKRRKAVKLIVGLTVLALVIVGIVGGMYWLFTREKPVHHVTEFIYRGMLETAVQGWGYIRPVEQADIAVLQKSRVKESFYMAGDMVFEGDLLFTLESDDLDKEIEALYKQIAEIQKKIDKADDNLSVILGDEAERIANLTVTAPFRGQLTEARQFKVGDYVTIGDRVGVLVDDINMSLSLYFSYAYEYDISVGQIADISIPSTMSVITGRVTQINKVRRISPEGTTLFEVVMSLQNPGTLTAGMEAGAIIRAGTEDIYPYETGELAYSRSETITIKAPGRLTYVNVMNYLDYGAGATLCSIEYKEDNSQVDALLLEIKNYELDIEKVEDEIAVKSEGYDNLNVTAPLSGTVMYNNLIPGQTVDPGLAVISIAQLEKMMVEAQVDERQVSQVRPGMPVQIDIWMMNGQMTMPGVVKSVSMMPADSINYGGSVVYYPAVFEMDNYSGQLMSGQGVNYRLIVEQRPDILIAPVIAVKNTEMGTCVFVKSDVRPDNAIDLAEGIVPPGFFAVPVECGIGNENGIEIMSGVEEGVEVFTQIIPLDEMDQMYGGRGGMIFYG